MFIYCQSFIFDMDELHKKYMASHESIKEKFRKKGLNEDQIKIEMNSIDLGFLKHIWMNGKDFTSDDPSARVKFYLDFLELELKEK